MLKPLLFCAFSLGCMAFGTTAVSAQEILVPQGVHAIQVVAASADPEGEVGNGMDPPVRAPMDPDIQTDEDLTPPPVLDNLPELEVGST